MFKVKVAVIDSGIDIYDKNIQEYIYLNREMQLEELKNIEDITDYNGHGTMCCKTIIYNTNTDNMIIYPIKIFNRSNKSSIDNLIYVLEKLKNFDIDIINISAAIINSTKLYELKKVCDELSSQGKIIVSSEHKNSNGEDSFPAIYDNVIGVKKDNLIKDKSIFVFDKNKKIQVRIKVEDVFISFNNKVSIFGRNSRGAALFTSILINMFIDKGKMSYKEIVNELSEKEMLVENLYNTYNNYSSKNNDYIKKILVEIINKKFSKDIIDLSFLEKFSIMNNITGINIENINKFVNEINKNFDINIDIENLPVKIIDNIDSLVFLINKNIKV